MPPKAIHTKYKKCPFCGGEAKLRGANSGMYWMQCQNCGAMTRETVTSQEAQELWKRRVVPETVVKIVRNNINDRVDDNYFLNWGDHT